MVFYRKYRPQTIEELDSSKLRETLKAVLTSKQMPHAFLFTGPKGLGKTSTARIVAKVINCTHTVDHSDTVHDTGEGPNEKTINQEPKTKNKEQKEEKILSSKSLVQNAQGIDPDNTCEQCVSITNGTNIDVLEIDGASNRGIDEIRELREKVKLSPSLAKKKVYIIDEVHMLTTEAFNALLKTIEEPPAHAVFIFCTTEAHKVPSTIVSRCFHVSFTLASEDELVRSLQRIVKGEKLQVEKEALQCIAHLAEGGFRDATKILEEMVALANGKEITKAFVEEKLHVSGISYLVSRIFEFLIDQNTKEALLLVQEISAKGIDIQYFLTELLEYFHGALLAKVGITEPTKYEIRNTKYEIGDIQMLVSLFSDAYSQTKYAVIPTLPLEMAIIVWGESKKDSRFMIQVSGDQKNNQGSMINDQQKPKTITSTGPTIDTLKKQQQTIKVQNILHPQKKEDSKKQVPQVTAEQLESSRNTDAKGALLDNLLYKIRPMNASIAGVLRGCKVKEITDAEIILEANYTFHKEKLEEAKTLEIIERSIKEITGRPLRVRVLLKQ